MTWKLFHIPGIENLVADTLSRIPVHPITLPDKHVHEETTFLFSQITESDSPEAVRESVESKFHFNHLSNDD